MAEPEERPTAAGFVARARAARLAAGHSQAWVAAEMTAAGATAWRQTTVGKVEAGQRALTLDEAYALGGLLGVPVAPVARPAGDALAGDGLVTAAVRSDIDALGDLVGMEPSLAAAAVKLAGEMNSGGRDGGRLLPALTRELRATLVALAGGRDQGDEDDDDDLASPD